MALLRISVCVAAWLLAAGSLWAQDAERPALPSLNSVVWNGPGTSLEALRGKTVVILSYVTWCPKCNAWLPDALDQLKTVIRDKPVVVLAISTETPSVPGPVYMAQMKFAAPNILHGHDPTIDGRFGFDGLIDYAIISPEGEIVVPPKSVGTFYNRPEGRQYTIGVNTAKIADSGTFELLDPEMSDAVKQVLWALEMGRIIPEREMAKVRRLLSVAQREELQAALDRFVERQMELIEKLAEGDVPDKIQAYENASQLAVFFRRNQRAAAARAIANELKKDRTFRSELAARAAYEKTLSLITRNPERREQLLEGFAKRHEETYFGKVAADSLKVEPDVNASKDAEAVAE